MKDSYQELTDKFIKFYKEYYEDEIAKLAQQYPREKRSLYIDYDDLYQFNSEIATDFISNPSDMREYAEEALRLFDLPVDIQLKNAHVRLKNLDNTIQIRDIRIQDEHIGGLIQVKGILRKTTDVKPKITEAAFECERCGTLNYEDQETNQYVEPEVCHACEREGPFAINFDQSNFIDSQKLRLQEQPEELAGGQKPQDIDIQLEDDITGEVTPGNTITAVGVLRVKKIKRGDSTLFNHFLEGVSIIEEDEEMNEIDVDEEDKEKIEALSEKDDIYTKLAESIAPTIYGYPDVKLAIGLQLFGGVKKRLPDGSTIRGDFHMLLIGDPGTGKSILLGRIKDIAPKSIFTSGKGGSAAGLTASAVKDGFGTNEQWSLQAGALVLADQGIAAVDELDKMAEKGRSSLHEALSQQTVSISKAGINSTLQARTSLLAAANPVHGKFNQYEPIPNQIDLKPALISRFDLIFPVTDTPDPKEDGELADHVLNNNQIGEIRASDQKMSQAETQHNITVSKENVTPEISPELLRKYVGYAKQNYFPAMSTAAQNTIQEFYVDVRSKATDKNDAIPITARKLEAIVRLAEASARVRLSNTVTEADAERAIDIVEHCLNEVGLDPETGELDADMIETGQSQTDRKLMKTVKEIIDHIADENGDGHAHIDDIQEYAAETNIDEHTIEQKIDELMEMGDIYEPQTNHYSTAT